MVDLYGIDVGEYITPMDPMGMFGMMPLPVTVVSEGLKGSPTKEVIILVAEVECLTCMGHHKNQPKVGELTMPWEPKTFISSGSNPYS